MIVQLPFKKWYKNGRKTEETTGSLNSNGKSRRNMANTVEAATTTMVANTAETMAETGIMVAFHVSFEFAWIIVNIEFKKRK